MYLEHIGVKSSITEASIEEALKNHFNCYFMKDKKEGYDEVVRVRHLTTTDEEWQEELNPDEGFGSPPKLYIVISKQEVDRVDEAICSIYSVDDETGDAHQYLMGAALSSNMIAAACYFAT